METDQDFVDQDLLQQFRCMGTTDKDELIKQFKILVGNHVDNSSAMFLLDMNDWNLQAAVGSYFDFEMSTKVPSMSFIRVLNEENSNVFKTNPSTTIEKFWILLNDGEDIWPPGCNLQFSGGDKMSQHQRIPVPSLEPNQTTKVMVNLCSPSKPGVYKSEWRMATSYGAYFGDIIWVIMTVVEEEPTSLITQLSNLNTSSDMVESAPSSFIVNNSDGHQ